MNLARKLVVIFSFMLFAIMISFGSTKPVFAPGAPDFDQCANSDSPTPDGTCHWIGSILHKTNSIYYEGMIVPQRIVYTEQVLAAGVHDITFTYDYTKAGKHAYDFLATVNPTTGFVQGVTGTSFLPGITDLAKCANLPDLPQIDTTVCNLLTSGTATSLLVPHDPFDSKDGGPTLPGTGSSQATKETNFESAFGGPRFITIYSSSPTAFSSPSITLTHSVGDNLDTGDSSVKVDIKFTSGACTACNYTIYFGGHLAVGGPDDTSGSNWGTGIGSSSIKGGPYHIGALQLDGNGGSQDNPFNGGDLAVPSQSDLIVVKNVNNNYGGTGASSDFTMLVGATGASGSTSFSFAGSTGGVDNIIPPGTYSVGETGPSGYTGSFSADCSGAIVAGQVKICTVTNNDLPAHLIVIKNVNNNFGGTGASSDFTMLVGDTGASGLTSFSFAGSTGGVDTIVPPGTFAVGETGPTGYTGTFDGCTGAISIGETKTCTITNNDLPAHLIVIKNVNNNFGGTGASSDFTMLVGDTGASGPTSFSFAGSTGGVDTIVPPGTFAVGEIGPTGYTGSFNGCTGAITIGETKTCTITNNDLPAYLIVIKHVINDNAGTSGATGFTMIVSGVTGATGITGYTGPTGNSFPGSESGVAKAVMPGTFAVGETGPTGYGATFVGCTGSISFGETKTCTITNNDFAPTRTQGFWNNQVKIVRQVLGMSPTGTNLNIPAANVITLGGSTSGKLIDDLPSYFGSFVSGISKNSDGTARTALTHAKMQLVQQAVASIMNCKMGSSPGFDTAAGKNFLDGSCNATPGTSVGDAINLGTNNAANVNEINRVAGLLDTFNNSHDSIGLGPTLNALLGANPAIAQSNANTIFNDIAGSAGPETGTPTSPNGLSGTKGYDDKYWQDTNGGSAGFEQPFDT